MTETQRIWLEELIEEHKVAASNERLWAKGSPDAETAAQHERNMVENLEFADMLTTLLNN